MLTFLLILPEVIFIVELHRRNIVYFGDDPLPYENFLIAGVAVHFIGIIVWITTFWRSTFS